MQIRVREDFFDKEIGNKKFAKFIKLAERDNHKLSDFKEYYENIKFKMDGYEMIFDKKVKNVEGYYLNVILQNLHMRKELDKFLKEDK